MSDFISVTEAASQLYLSPQAVRKKLRQGSLSGERIGKTWIVSTQSLAKYLAAEPELSNIDNTSISKPLENVNDANQFVALSFFSGAMGLDLGLEKAGFNFKLACEFDKTCQATIHANKPNMPLIGNIMDYNAEDIRKIAKIEGDIDLIVGGPPCQAFSTAGARKGFEDKRGNVFLYYIEMLLKLRPKYIVIENVRGLLSAPLKHIPHKDRQNIDTQLLNQPGGALLYIVERLRSGGYSVSFNLYNAANFGVPQSRERVVILCSRDGRKIPYLTPTNSEDPKWNLTKWKTLGDSIKNINRHSYIDFPEQRLKYLRLLKEGQYWKDLPVEIQKVAMGNSFHLGGGKTGFYRRLSFNKPSCTLVTSPIMPATTICHPTEDRPLSIEEYKRVQMFPDSWILKGTLIKQYKQVGNAVPTGLGFAIGKTILAHANRENVPEFVNFPYSRYKNTDETSWEIITRAKLGLTSGETLLSKQIVQEIIANYQK